MEIRVLPYMAGKTPYISHKKTEPTQQLKYLNDTVSFRGQDINPDNLSETSLYQLNTLKEFLDITAAKEENIIKNFFSDIAPKILKIFVFLFLGFT